MTPSRITFTGVDEMTDVEQLVGIQNRWPVAEFGVLVSYDQKENGNRFPNPRVIDSLRGRNLNLALHLCGKAARDAAEGRWDRIAPLTTAESGRGTAGNIDIFRRIQLNVAGRNDIPQVCQLPLFPWQEIIIQGKDTNDTQRFHDTRNRWGQKKERFSLLLDGSGGRGLETKLEILPIEAKIGYAGGFSPENVEEKLRFLMENVQEGMFWIDMENRVRTNDIFDLRKVVEVLKAYDRIVKKH